MTRPADLRAWIARIESLGELQHVSGAHWNQEIGAISEINYRRKPSAALLFDDIAGYLAGVAGKPETLGEAFDAGGPEVMTYRQMIERIAALLGRKPAIVEVPVLTPYLSSLWLNLVTPVNASVARPLIEGLRNPTIAREERIRKLLPLELTPFDEAARRALA